MHICKLSQQYEFCYENTLLRGVILYTQWTRVYALYQHTIPVNSFQDLLSTYNRVVSLQQFICNLRAF
jgi:hypothetical protein